MNDSITQTQRRLDKRPILGLVLTGGGARSAYQVGVLRALAEIFPRGRSPFQVIVGTSAGAVAASVLAAEAAHWRRAVVRNRCLPPWQKAWGEPSSCLECRADI